MAFEQVSATVGTVVRTAERVTINLTNGTSYEFPGTWDEFAAKVNQYFKGWSSESAMYLGLARWIARNPTGANPNQIEGKTVTVNPGVANIANFISVS